MAYVEEDAERIFQTVIIGIAFIIGAAATIAITGSTILDSSPSSYIIVTMLMGVLMIFFTLNDKKPATTGDYGVIGAVVAFLAYLILLSYSRGLLSFEFVSYRVDALLLPMLLLSIVLAVSGFKGIRKYSAVMAYLLFSSPILLLPILKSNAGLAIFSSRIVYGILSALGTHVVQVGQSIVAPSGQAITIAATCVPLSTFIAFLMLLIPVAYLYQGRPEQKISWLCAGMLLLFVLNILRMAFIALAWTYWGIGSAVATFHAVGGGLMFYVAIIIMLLVHRKFGLKLNWGNGWMKRLKLAFGAYDLEENYGKIIVALLIGFAALFFTAGYLGPVNVPATQFSSSPISNSSYNLLYQSIFSRVNASGVQYSYLGSYQSTMLFELGKSSPDNSTYMIVSFYPNMERGANVAFYAGNSSPSFYLEKSGITMTSLSALSNNATFYLSYFAVPLIVNGTGVTANFEIFANAATKGLQYCDPGASSGLADYIGSSIYNLFETGTPAHSAVLCSAQQLAET